MKKIIFSILLIIGFVSCGYHTPMSDSIKYEIVDTLDIKYYYHPFIKMTAKEIWDKDEKRISEYIQNGWRVFVIWESDDLKEKINELKEIYG